MYEEMQESGLSSSLWYAPQLSGASILLSHPKFPQGSLSEVAAVWWLLDGKCSLFPSWVPSGLSSSSSELAAITDDCDIFFFYWYGRQCFISQFFILVENLSNLGDISWPILVPWCWDILLRSGKAFVDMPLWMLISGLGSVDN